MKESARRANTHAQRFGIPQALRPDNVKKSGESQSAPGEEDL